ncbi:MAG: response regulator [Methanococcaceae archaeon]
MHESHRAVEILLVEDNPGDVRLTQEAFLEGKVWNNIHVAKDGVEAISFLKKRDNFAKAPRPDIILLDLNLPKKNGREVLAEIKSDNTLKSIPVIILTTSQAEKDITESYELNANCFITKPVDLDDFFRVIKTLQEFWLKIVKLPPNTD